MAILFVAFSLRIRFCEKTCLCDWFMPRRFDDVAIARRPVFEFVFGNVCSHRACLRRSKRVKSEKTLHHGYNFGELKKSTSCKSLILLVLPEWIEHSTSPLPRGCSTTELRQHERSQSK